MGLGGRMTLVADSATVPPPPVPLFRRADVANAARAVRAGELVRVGRGTYAPAESWRTLAPWHRYLARVHAAARSHPDAVLVLESAAAVRGLPVFGEPPDVHLLVSDPAKSRRLPGVQVHTTERMPTVECRGGILIASAADVAVDMARLRHPAIALAVAGSALRADPNLTVGMMAAASAARPTPRGARAVPWVLERASPVAESPLEHVSIAVIEWLGFPPPELQRWILGRDPHDEDRVDLWWEQWGIAGEADGDIKYSGVLGDAREALNARNARDARLLRKGVRATAHWALRDLVACEQVRAILPAAGLPIIRPEQTGPLLSLARALRGHPARGVLPVT